MKKKINHLFCKLIEWITLNHFTIYNREIVSVSYLKNLKFYMELSEQFRSTLVESEESYNRLMIDNIKMDAKNHQLICEIQELESKLSATQIALSKSNSQHKNLQGRYNQIDKQYQALKISFNSQYGSRNQKEMARRTTVKNHFEKRTGSLKTILENVNAFNLN